MLKYQEKAIQQHCWHWTVQENDESDIQPARKTFLTTLWHANGLMTEISHGISWALMKQFLRASKLSFGKLQTSYILGVSSHNVKMSRVKHVFRLIARRTISIGLKWKVAFCSYGPLPVISTYNPIDRMYSPIYNQLWNVITNKWP